MRERTFCGETSQEHANTVREAAREFSFLRHLPDSQKPANYPALREKAVERLEQARQRADVAFAYIFQRRPNHA